LHQHTSAWGPLMRLKIMLSWKTKQRLKYWGISATVFKNTSPTQQPLTWNSIGMDSKLYCLKFHCVSRNGFITAHKISEQELQIQREAWQTEWLSGQKEIGEFKINLILTHIHLLLPVLLDWSCAKFGNGLKELKLTETWPSDMEEACKVWTYWGMEKKISKEELPSTHQDGKEKR